MSMEKLPPKPPAPRPVEPRQDFVGAPESITLVKPVDESQAERPVHSAIPGVTESKMFFEVFIFHPEDGIPKAALIEVLRAAQLRFGPELFDKLTPEAKRQFLRLDRTGTIKRYRPQDR